MQASDIQPRTVPRHLAIIMDGNNRGARREGYPGVAGPLAGAEVVREIVSACESRGIRYLTLFAFSSENWGRSRTEVRALLTLLSRYLRNEVAKLASDGVRLRVIGRRDRFSPRLQRLMAKAEAATATGDRATLTLALDYGGRWDVTQVAQSLARDVASGKMSPDDINEDTISQRLATQSCLTRISVSAPRRHASLISCCGSLPTPNSGLPKSCGPISTRPYWILPSLTTRCGSDVLASARFYIATNSAPEKHACSARG